MKAERYVDKIAGKIKCSASKKKEIKKELLLDMKLRQEQGESLADIIAQMGSIREVADGFNENIPPKEKKQYVLKKIVTIAASVMILLFFAVLFLYDRVPKSADIKNSSYFDSQLVEDAVKETIILLDDGNYSELQKNAIEQMKELLNEEVMNQAKAQIGDDWGKRQSFGAVYMTEMIQGDEHFAVAEIAVSYENVSAVYRLTYDQNMKLAGIYVR